MAKTHSSNKPPRKQGFNRSKNSLNPDRRSENIKGVQCLRTRSTIKRLQMYRKFKAKRDRCGKVKCAAPFQGWVSSGKQARIEPNKKWFDNSRVSSQSVLQNFQEKIGKVIASPYDMVMKPTKLPITLLNEKSKYNRSHLLDTETFESTFGMKKTRNKPCLKFKDEVNYAENAKERNSSYNESLDYDLQKIDAGEKEVVREWIMTAGQSKRIWNELFKVIDSSDVVLLVLDARDPLGTRSHKIEEFIAKNKGYKHIVYILNKVDLVPVWVTSRWVVLLSKKYPTIAFHASLTHSFGKGTLINLLRQFAELHSDKKQISVGLVGYPNVGKSSIINTLCSRKVCKVAPIPGETKVWQYVTLMRRVYLIDCPGVIHSATDNDDSSSKIFKGIVRTELVSNPDIYISFILNKIDKKCIQRTYNIEQWEDSEDFLRQVARKKGKLLKRGEPDINTTAKMILNDAQRGRIPYYVIPTGFSTSSTQSIKLLTGIKEDNLKLHLMQNFNGIKVASDIINEYSSNTQKTSKIEEREFKDFSKKLQNIGEFNDKDIGMFASFTSKERRRMLRNSRLQKHGGSYYEIVDIKNRRK